MQWAAVSTQLSARAKESMQYALYTKIFRYLLLTAYLVLAVGTSHELMADNKCSE